MKQFKSSLLLASMLCVLIGYFEPANAQLNSMTAAGGPAATSLLSVNTPNCQFYPNPIGQGAVVTAISIDIPTGGYLINTLTGDQYDVAIIAVGLPLPAGVVENNQYFVPIVSVGDGSSSDPSSADASASSDAASTQATGGVSTTSASGAASSSGSSDPSDISTDGSSSSAPAGVVENNCYYEPAVISSTLSLPVVSAGTYLLVITGRSGNTYASQINISR